MKKAALRMIFKEKRRSISSIEKNKSADLLLINFQQLELPFVTCVHTYLAMDGEIDTGHIIRYLTFRNPGLLVCVPKIDVLTGRMKNFVFTEDTELVFNRFGIEEPFGGEEVDPREIDLVLVPLLAFDTKGNRVGFGKGFYDKFLDSCRSDVIKIGLSLFEAVELIEDTDQHDIPLNFCVTPKQVYHF